MNKSNFVIPAQAGIQKQQKLDPRLREDDGLIERFIKFILVL